MTDLYYAQDYGEDMARAGATPPLHFFFLYDGGVGAKELFPASKFCSLLEAH